MLSVAIVHDNLLPVPPIRGGAVQTYTQEIIKYIVPFLDITIYSVSDPELSRRGYTESKLHYVYISSKGIIPKVILTLGKLEILNPFWNSLFYSAEHTIQIGFRLFLKKPDIIHIQNRPQYVWLLKKSSPRSKVILHMHNRHLTGLSKEIVLRIVPLIDMVVCCSNYIARDIIKNIPELSDRIKVIYGGVDTAQFHPRLDDATTRKFRNIEIDAKRQKVILFVGRLIPEKGVHYLLQAMEKVIRRYPDVVLVIAGSPSFGTNIQDEYSANLKTLSSNIKNNIIFTGFVVPSEIHRVYKLADVFVGPSSCEEAFGLVFLEAAATGLPVVASRRGGIPEVVKDGETGLLIDDPSRLDILSEKIMYILDNPVKAKEMGQNARNFVKRTFTWEIIANNLLNVYESFSAT